MNGRDVALPAFAAGAKDDPYGFKPTDIVVQRDGTLMLTIRLGGLLFDRTGSYDIVWYISIALGVFAALVNLPVKETAIAREAQTAAA